MKKNMVFIFSTLAILTILVFYLPALTRADDCPEPLNECYLYEYQLIGEPTQTNYVLRVKRENGEWPIFDSSTRRYKWQYELLNFEPDHKVVQMNTLAPDCCPKINYWVGPGGKIYPPGHGVLFPAFGFGFGDFQNWAISLPVSGAPIFSFYTDQYSTPGKSSIQVSSLKKVGFFKIPKMFACQEIAGPSSPDPLTTIAVSTNETIALDNGETWCLAKLQNSKCPAVVDCITLKERDWDPIQDVISANITSLGEKIFFAGAPGQDCPRVIFRTEATSGNSSVICSGGRCYH